MRSRRRSRAARVAWNRWCSPRASRSASTSGSAVAGPVELGDRDGPVQRDHRRRGEREQVVVERHDLAPVGRRARCAPPGSPPAPGTGRAARAADSAGRGAALLGQVAVPAARGPARRAGPARRRGAVRAGRRDSTSSMSASRPSTSGSSGISSASWRPSRIASAHRSPRTSASPAAGGVALGEDQVEHREHGRQPVGQVGLVRDAVRDPRLPDLVLGPDQPLRHRRLGDEEQRGRSRPSSGRPSSRRVSATCAGVRERGVAAGEDQAEPVVAHGTLLLRRRPGRAAARPRRAGRRGTTRGGAGRSPGCGPS